MICEVELLEAGEGGDPELLRSNRLDLGDALVMRAGPDDRARAASVYEAALVGCGADPSLCSILAAKLAQARSH
ncbi:hypothetical protein ENSA5_44400 [Enhygromyxa salina]|uniref:Uncharacterized protein n=1 Tax=Enhygromyxa salina TaxID=215803 RepID=A0A2S9XJZ3_9BACT|nr:hypothetical protein [Enhygromyxa salina]PRP93173.1 hypothetical protein ENSA5_44400 [Enhygromyxa salina]